MAEYKLMHKDDVCGVIILDDDVNKIVKYTDNRNGLSPYLGAADTQKMKKWWEMRTVPASRRAVQEMIKKSGCINPEGYLAKNLALSMTDNYWLKPDGSNLKYANVKFENLIGYNGGHIPYHNITSFDPNASLGGQMDKYWDLSQSPPALVKESYRYYGQQGINEVFATMIHEAQGSKIPFVKYTVAETDDRGIMCMCDAFTSENIEFISAYEIIESIKNKNEQSLYDAYISICIKNGIDEESIQNFMDYQTMTDFLISNTDEHLLNFGVLRNAESMSLIGPAPIFDSGNSMFFSDTIKRPYTRAEILYRDINSLYKREEKMIAKVKNRSILNLDLVPSPKEVKNIFAESGIPEWKANVISKNYETKNTLLKELQKGKTISLYLEKRREKESLTAKSREIEQKFILMCGVPGSGKSIEAEYICNNLNMQRLDAKEVYPIENIVSFSGVVTHKSKIHSDEVRDKVILISANEIRDEIKEKYPQKYSESLVFDVVDARIDLALSDGASIVYDAMNLDKNTRLKYLNKAKDIAQTELHIMKTELSMQNTRIDWSEGQMLAFSERLKNSIPETEPWDRVIFHDSLNLSLNFADNEIEREA